jgi:hypothetical protein
VVYLALCLRVQDKVISADDLLPLTVYLVIKSGLRYLHTNCQYLTNFPLDPNDGLNLNGLGVHLANFVGAVKV